MTDRSKPNGSTQVVAEVSEIPAGTHKVVRVGGLDIGIFNVHGEFYALHNVCPHQFGPVCSGTIGCLAIANKETDWQMQLVREGEILTCPWHGMEFDLKSGQSTSQKQLRLRMFPVQIVDNKVCIDVRSRRPAATPNRNASI